MVLAAHPEVRNRLPGKRVRALTYGALLRRGYVRYWARDLKAARWIFRAVMRQGYGRPADWKYMAPALLPEAVHRKLIAVSEVARPAKEGPT